MNLETSDHQAEMPITHKNKSPGKKPGRCKLKVTYKEDIAGLWVFIEFGDLAAQLTDYPITNPGKRQLIKTILDQAK